MKKTALFLAAMLVSSTFVGALADDNDWFHKWDHNNDQHWNWNEFNKAHHEWAKAHPDAAEAHWKAEELRRRWNAEDTAHHGYLTPEQVQHVHGW